MSATIRFASGFIGQRCPFRKRGPHDLLFGYVEVEGVDGINVSCSCGAAGPGVTLEAGKRAAVVLWNTAIRAGKRTKKGGRR